MSLANVSMEDRWAYRNITEITLTLLITGNLLSFLIIIIEVSMCVGAHYKG